MWIDSHCHLDAPEFGEASAPVTDLRARARAQGVRLCVLPAVAVAHFDGIRQLAHQTGDAYALGIHPLYVPQADDGDLARLDDALTRWHGDPRLVAVGEIGLDFFVPALCTPGMRERQTLFYREQLRLARRHGLPVILHVRRSADALLKHLRQIDVAGGIAHAFNGSEVQAQAFVARGFKLGFGGALTFDTARQLRRLATGLPLDALVLETDAPDMPPQWLYTPAARRAAGEPQGLNTPAELPRIGGVLAQLRGIDTQVLAEATTANAVQALPRLAPLLDGAH
ncbi:TatD family hydrolase [Hydrogenophaga sp. OTU3427]|uniref:TatD family hydrolase n=1 Tax=Hydrogenophaga sp. OTU3427 TaxID=3043856 RepID=UPI00313AE5BC